MDSSEKGSADIIKSDSGRVFVTQRALVGMHTVWSSILHLSTWLCVPSQIIGAWCAVAEVEDAQRRKAEDYAEFPPETEWTERLPC